MGFFSAVKKWWQSDLEENKVQELNIDYAQDQKDLAAKFRESDSKLSSWLKIIFEGQEEANDLLWSRLHFLFTALEVPKHEAEEFIRDFKVWLDSMEYKYLQDFQSELQYRLALALDMEDEEDEHDRTIIKLQESLSKTREQLGMSLNKVLSSHKEINQDFWDELEEIFIMSDMGAQVAADLNKRLQKKVGTNNISQTSEILPLLQEELKEVFTSTKRLTTVFLPEVVLMIGVNGVGKTTSIAKLAYRAKLQGKKVLIVAGDTFRAAAIEQLEIWANRVGVDFFAKSHGTDPAAVAFEAMDIALEGKYDIVFMDTAGRLHTKQNLMEELHKIRKIISKKHQGAPHRNILVIDATTGQNALEQTRIFKESCGIDEIILSKLDGTAKGGIAIAIAMQHKLPISFIGLGEKMEDLKPFNADDYTQAILAHDKRDKRDKRDA